MATAEPASNSSGPRYAPDDPTLPKPWKGLMDGNLLYYWNPETNVTQYEKPASLAPPLPLGPPPGTSTPKLAAIPMVRTMQSNGVVPQPVQQMAHAPSPQTQQISQTGQQYGHIPQQQQSKGVVPQPIQQMAQAPSPQTQQISQTGQQYGHIPQQLQSNGVVPQPMQQMAQAPSPQTQQVSQTGQQYGHIPQQQASQIAQVPQHQNQHMSYQGSQIVQVPQQLNQQMSYQGSQMVTPIQQQEQLVQQPLRQQTLPHMGPHLSQQPGQQTPQNLGHQMQQQVGPPTDQRTPQQLGPQMQQQSGQQNPLQHGNQFPHPQLQQMSYQQSPSTHGQQVQHQQAQHLSHQQGQQYASHQVPQFKPQQVQKPSFPKREDYDFQQGKQISGPSSQVSHSGVSSLNNMPGVSHSVQIPPIGVQSARPQQYGSSAVNAPQTSSSIQLLQAGSDSMHQPHMSGNVVQNQTRTIVMHSQQSGGPPVGVKMGNEEDVRGRTGNEFYLNPIKDGLESVHQQPKHPAVPMALNQQDMRISRAPPQNVAPGHSGGLNMIAGHAAPNMYNHAAGGQAFPANIPLGGPPSRMPPSDLTNFSPAEAYRRQHEVTATGDNVPAPFMTFEDTGFPQQILREIHSAGFSAPTPIQAQTWPIALQSRDIVAIAKTGSGKTLGYLIPAFIHLSICHNNPQRGPTVLVLAPTRELATQIQYEAIKFGRTSRFSCTCLYGGAPKPPQIKELERGADIVVATPGRLNDILEMKRIDFRQVSLLILDEADRMLDMGFEPQIRKIVNEIPPRRQTLMFTATWPKEVRKIAGDLLVNPVQVNIGNVDELAANKSITQYVEVVPQMQKERRLEQILRTQERGSKIIIFCSTKRLCDHLTRSIGRNFDAAAIHGDKSQGERDSVLNQFRSGKSPILVATDVAARGLDIKDIRVVINYDFPTGIEDYVHRIGRTGRAGATGVAYTFFSDQDWKYAADLVKVLEGANQPVPPEVREMASRSGPSFGRGRGGMNRDSAPGRWGSVGERDGGFGGRGGDRDGGFGGRGGDRNGGFGGRGGDRSGGFGSRGSDRDGGFGGRGGDRDGGFGGRGGDRDGGFGGRGGRRDFYGGRGNRGGRGFSGPGNGPVGWGRNDRGPDDRFNMDRRGRFNDNRGPPSRSRGRSYSRSPEKVRTWGYSRSPSRSRSRSRSWSRGRSRSRSWSRSRSRSYSRSRSRSRSVDRYGRSHRHTATQNSAPQSIAGNSTGPEHSVPLEPTISSISLGMGGGVPPVVESDGPSGPVAAGLDPSFQPVTDQN